MKFMVVRYEVLEFWFILNFNDIRNPLELLLSIVELNLACNVAKEAGQFNFVFCAVTATMNSSSVASFFHRIIESSFKYLVIGEAENDSNTVGYKGVAVFRALHTYYTAVEINGCGIFHLHAFM